MEQSCSIEMDTYGQAEVVVKFSGRLLRSAAAGDMQQEKDEAA
jgi:hypothetical protein